VTGFPQLASAGISNVELSFRVVFSRGIYHGVLFGRVVPDNIFIASDGVFLLPRVTVSVFSLTSKPQSATRPPIPSSGQPPLVQT
jgi:hypothetical protein